MVLAAVDAASHASAQEFALRDGDRVVFYGDSITEDGRYARTVETFVATRFPDWTISFWNAGVGGDKVSGGWAGDADTRLQRDVIAHKPTLVTIMLGMNDAAYRANDPAVFDAYATGYRKLAARLKEALPGVRLTLILPSAYDDISRPVGFAEGYNAVLRRYGAFVQELAGQLGATTVDLNAPLVAGLEKVQRVNPVLARQLIPDRVHPAAAGHLVMAGALLRAWNAPATVSRVELESSAAGTRILRTDRADVILPPAKGGGYLEWSQSDKALPLPVSVRDGEAELAEMAGAGLEGLNQQLLRITGLSAGRYEVVIDGTVVGRFSEAELLAGVNLAREETPMARQARPVAWKVEERHELELVRRRLLVAAGDPKAAEAAATLAVLDTRAQQERQTLARPSVRRYEVRRSYAFR
jgi:lysophospholipase L1-like esterase